MTTKNTLHCLAINNKSLTSSLTGMFKHWEGDVQVEIIADNPATIIKRLMKKNTQLLFISSNAEQRLNTYKLLLNRYSADTILVNLIDSHQPLMRDLSGLESCSMPLEETPYRCVFISNLLNYSQLKKDFRRCKQLLSITDQRNRWLVNITSEPIAYLFEGTHIHANSSYLSLFGFQSMAELKSSTVDSLIPDKSKTMFRRFMQKQQYLESMQQTLMLTMNSVDNTLIRVRIRMAPAVINSIRCMQLWTHKLEENLEQEVAQDDTLVSPWENLPNKKAHITPPDNDTSLLIANSFTELRESIKNTTLEFMPLTDTLTSTIKHYFVKLKYDTQEKLVVDQKLSESKLMSSPLFWNRLLLLELTDELNNNYPREHQLLLSLTASSFNNNAFINFFIQCLQQLPDNHPHLIFLIPHHVFMNHHGRIKKLNRHIRHLNSSLGVYNFIPDRLALKKAITQKPTYISYSSKWLKCLSGNQTELDKFKRINEHLESKGIETILP